MKTSLKLLVGTIATLACFVGAAPSARAGSNGFYQIVGGWAGSPVPGSTWSCFSESGGTVTNICGYQQVWEMPLITDATGVPFYSPHFNIHFKGGANQIACAVVTAEDTGFTTFSTGWVWNGQYDTVIAPTGGQGIRIPTSTGHPGYMYGACFMNQNSEIASVVW
jgi:hypothetical protein